jgi:Tfp pilus assembly protein PilF
MTLPRLCTILVLTLASVIAGCATPPPKTEIEKVTISDASNSERALEAHRRGVAFLTVGKTFEAQDAFMQAISIDPGCGPAHNNLGIIYLQQNQLYEAAWEFESACKLMSAQAEPENNLGMVFEKAGKIDQAVEHYTKAHQLAPDQVEILGNLARARVRRGDRDAVTRDLLIELVMRENRPAWIAWAKEKLALITGVRTDPVPRDTLPKPEPDDIFNVPKMEN